MTPTREELLARVREIAAVLRDTAAESEARRALVPEAVDALHASGLIGLWSPTEIGGFDADYVTQVDVLTELARIDMSACWNLMISASVTALMACGLNDEGLDEVFSGDRLATGASSLKPAGKAEATAGGYRATGRWAFGSGIHHGSHIVATCLLCKDGKPVKPYQPLALVVPIAEVEIHDDWHVMGLCGSGSSSYSIADVFVPSHLALAPERHRGSPHNCSMTPRIPLEHAAIALGGARRVLDEVTAQAVSKRRLVDPATVASKQGFRVELGRLEARWLALRAGVRDCASELYEALHAQSPDVSSATARLRALCALAAEDAVDIAWRAFRHAGAAAVQNSECLSRYQRDLVVAGQHFMISDISYELYGNTILDTD